MRWITMLTVAGLLALAVGPAPAAEKMPDLVNVAAEPSWNPPVSGSLTTLSGVWDRIYNLGDVAPGCGAEALDSANDGMYYDLYCLQVDDNQPIELVLDANGTNIIDTVLALYCDPFNPEDPTAGLIAYDDDGGVGTLSAFSAADGIVLQPGSEYWLVISSYGAGMTGDYVVQASSNVYDCGSVSREATSWGTVKGLYR